MAKKKIAICSIDDQGHIQPALALARALREQGHRVDYITPSDSTRSFEEIGATVYKVASSVVNTTKNTPPRDGFGSERLIDWARNLVIEDAILNVPWFIAYCERETPDVVLFDKMCVAAGIGAAHCRIPSVMLHPFYCGNHLLRGGHPIFDTPHSRDALLRLEQQVDSLRALTPRAPDSVERLLSDHATTNIVFVSKEFHPHGEQLKDQYCFVGPQLPKISKRPRSDKNLVYVSLGTLFGTGQYEVFWDCIHALSNTQYEVVVTIGRRNSLDAFRDTPGNVRVFNFVDQHEVLADAAVFVTHGGMTSIQDAIWFEVPMVVIPQGFDQFVSAKRLEELDLGLNLERSTNRTVDVKSAVTQLSHSTRVEESLRQHKNYAEMAGGSGKAVSIIEALCT